MDNLKLFSLIFSWGVVNTLKFFLVILFFVFLIYKIKKRRYPCRVFKSFKTRSDEKRFQQYGKESGRESNDNC